MSVVTAHPYAAYEAAATAETLSDDDADRWMLLVTGGTVDAASCTHIPLCPAADATDHDAAKVIAHDYTAGYSILCNGVVVFDDTGELVPDDSPCGCHVEAPHRPEPQHRPSKEF